MQRTTQCAQLVLSCLGRVERCRGVACQLISDNQICMSASCAGARESSISVEALPSETSSANLPSPLGLGVMRSMRQSGFNGVSTPHGWSSSQVRHMSWRRHLPSMHNVRNAAEDPGRQVTNLLLAINLATYLLTKFDRGVAVHLAMIPYQVARGEWHRLLTCGFLHLDFLHLLVNMLSVHWLGPAVESAAGRGRFAAIYLLSVLGGSWAQYTFGSFSAVSMGASGGVFGLFGAYLVYRLRNRHFVQWDRGDTSWLMQVVAINAALGFMAGGTISQIAHLGGALAGATSCWLIGPRYTLLHGRLVDQPLLPLFRSRH